MFLPTSWEVPSGHCIKLGWDPEVWAIAMWENHQMCCGRQRRDWKAYARTPDSWYRAMLECCGPVSSVGLADLFCWFEEENIISLNWGRLVRWCSFTLQRASFISFTCSWCLFFHLSFCLPFQYFLQVSSLRVTETKHESPPSQSKQIQHSVWMEVYRVFNIGSYYFLILCVWWNCGNCLCMKNHQML